MHLITLCKIKKKTNVSRFRRNLLITILKLNFPFKVCRHVFEAMDKLVEAFVHALATEQHDAGVEERLGELIVMNHRLLGSLQVSNFALDTIVEVARANGFPCKLTGGGGGGCCYVLLVGANHGQLIRELSEKGFESFTARLGSCGVTLEEVGF